MRRTIICQDDTFNPDANDNPLPFVVKVGDTVVWQNNDGAVHNCVSTGNPKLPQEVPDFAGGTTSIEVGPFTAPTDDNGIKYTCTHHPGMDGVIKVER